MHEWLLSSHSPLPDLFLFSSLSTEPCQKELPSTGPSWGDGWQTLEEERTNRTAFLDFGTSGGCSSPFFLRNLFLFSLLAVQRAVKKGEKRQMERDRYIICITVFQPQPGAAWSPKIKGSNSYVQDKPSIDTTWWRIKHRSEGKIVFSSCSSQHTPICAPKQASPSFSK